MTDGEARQAIARPLEQFHYHIAHVQISNLEGQIRVAERIQSDLTQQSALLTDKYAHATNDLLAANQNRIDLASRQQELRTQLDSCQQTLSSTQQALGVASLAQTSCTSQAQVTQQQLTSIQTTLASCSSCTSFVNSGGPCPP